MSLDKDGVLSPQELKRIPGVPSHQRLKQGPCAVIECAQPIPCNPCEKACPSDAIKVGVPITNVPILDANKCSGCGMCIPSCPGLAIFVVDLTYDEKMAKVSIPYEFLPIPKKGDKIIVLGRKGEKLCDSRIISTKNLKRYDRTAIVSFTVPKEYVMEARHIEIKP